MVSAADLDVELTNTKLYSDVDHDHWTMKYAQIAYNLGLFDDIHKDTFGPNEPVSRGEVAEAMYRYMIAQDLMSK